jgi:hypothetical protein
VVAARSLYKTKADLVCPELVSFRLFSLLHVCLVICGESWYKGQTYKNILKRANRDKPTEYLHWIGSGDIGLKNRRIDGHNEMSRQRKPFCDLTT